MTTQFISDTYAAMLASHSEAVHTFGKTLSNHIVKCTDLTEVRDIMVELYAICNEKHFRGVISFEAEQTLRETFATYCLPKLKEVCQRFAASTGRSITIFQPLFNIQKPLHPKYFHLRGESGLPRVVGISVWQHEYNEVIQELLHH